MARKPNYRYERAERERLKAERQAVRDRRKAEGRDVASSPSEERPGGSSDSAVNPADDGSGRGG